MMYSSFCTVALFSSSVSLKTVRPTGGFFVFELFFKHILVGGGGGGWGNG